MARLPILLLALLAAGCAGGAAERPPGPQQAKPPQEVAKSEAPAYLNQRFTDGKIVVLYPQGWTRGRTKRFGVVLQDQLSPHPAFVAIQYLPRREYGTYTDFGRLAAKIIRPPHGEGTTLLYTQATRIGGRPGVEASLIWAYGGESPLGPTMRVFGIELESGEVAILIFAAERPRLHATRFGWIKRMITWV